MSRPEVAAAGAPGQAAAAPTDISLSDRLALHAAGVTVEDLPEAVCDATCRSMIDAVAVTMAASGLGEGIDAFAEVAFQTAPSGPSTVLGFGRSSSPAMAAWVNGAMAHALDFEDTHDHAIAHPHAAAVVAALAVAESLGDVDGGRVVAAVATAADLVCRLASSFETNPDSYGWHTTPWLGVFGASTAAGLLLDLPPEGMKSGWSLAASQMASFGAVRESPASHVRAVRDAFAAKAGVLGAQLAARGIVGFERPLEGTGGFLDAVARGRWRGGPILEDLGRRWMGAEVSLKPWPSCRGTHSPISAALEVRQLLAGRVGQVDEILVTVSEKNRMLCEPLAAKRRPQTAIGAKFSVPFCVAAALAHGAPSLATFGAMGLSDSATLALADKVRCVVDPAIPIRDTGTCQLEVRFAGEIIRCGRTVAPGHPSNPMTDQELRQKFEQCVGVARVPLEEAQMSGLWSGLLNLVRNSELPFKCCR